jgi:YaiO family outer membrane protein
MIRPGLAAVVLLASLACAAEDRPDPWEARAEAGHDSLDHGLAPWREGMLQLAWRPHTGLALFGGGRETERFDQRDREAFAGAYLPLGAASTLHLEASSSSTHHVLARSVALAEVSHSLGDGWVPSIGARLARYDASDVRTMTAGLEKYLGDWRFAYAGWASKTDTSGWAAAHRLSATWYHGELTYVTLAGARGREVENFFPAGLVTTDVRAASIAAGLELAPRIGVSAELAETRQGNLYRRRGVRIGSRFLF